MTSMFHERPSGRVVYRSIGHVTGTVVPGVLWRSGYLCRGVLATSSAAV